MASSSHILDEGLMGEETTPSVRREQDQEPCPAMVINLVKNLKAEKKSQTPGGGNDRVTGKLSFRLPKDCLKDAFVGEEVEGSSNNAYWSGPINFQLPADSYSVILAMDEEAEATGRLSLYQRLEGWVIEKRPREVFGRHDKYYYHKASNRKLRSFVEVENFIIYGRLPNKSERAKLAADFMPRNLDSIEESSSKRKSQAQSETDIIKRNKKMVEKFFASAFKNQRKRGTQKSPSSPRKKSEAKAKNFHASPPTEHPNSDTNIDQTSNNDCDEATLEMIRDLIHESPQIIFTGESEAAHDHQVEGDATAGPSQTADQDNEGQTLDRICLSYLNSFEEFIKSTKPDDSTG